MTSLTSLVFKPTALLLTLLFWGAGVDAKAEGRAESCSGKTSKGAQAWPWGQLLRIEYFEDGQFGHCNLQPEIYIDFLVSSSKVWLFQISSVSGGRFGARRLQLSDCRNWSKLFGWIAVDLGTQTSAGSTFCRPLSDCSKYIYIYNHRQI